MVSARARMEVSRRMDMLKTKGRIVVAVEARDRGTECGKCKLAEKDVEGAK